MIKNLLPSKLTELQPALVAFPVLFIGFIMVALSFFWDLGSVKVSVFDNINEVKIVKEVGYGSAINWSLGITLFLPAAILYLLKTFRSFNAALRNMTKKKMVLKNEFSTIVSEQEILNLWFASLDRYRRWLVILVTLGLFFSLWEWYVYSAKPLFYNNIEHASEWDWSVGALLTENGTPDQATQLDRLKNSVLSFAAFCGQATIIAVAILLVFHSLIAAIFFSNLTQNNSKGLYLIPDPKSEDKRKGFEILSEYIEHMLLLVSILYAIFYMSRLQNIYLRSSSTSIIEFIKEDLLTGLIENPFDIGVSVNVLKVALEGSSTEMDYSSIMVSLAAFSIMMVAAYVVGTTVREAAKQSKQNLESLNNDNPKRSERIFDLPLEKICTSIKEMVFWPVDYIKAGQFFALIFLGVFCILFYRIGVVLIAFLLLKTFWEITKYIFGKSSEK